jgi:glucose/mannose-6-phosphate isomerase
MEDSILKFNEQFTYEPEIQNAEHLGDFDHIILCGMGGSHLAADLIKTIKPGIDIYVHRDYDLPPYEDDFLKRGLLVACSYSGNTEETLSFFQAAYDKELKVAAISTGGKLLEGAKENEVPYIEIPETGIQPRQADGFFALAILKLMGDEDTIASWSMLAEKIDPKSLKERAGEIVEEIGDKTPLIYSSTRNLHIAYNWKITLNETAKIPCFYNVFPELNHNEMQGLDTKNEGFHVIFIQDDEDHEQIKKRMEITKELYEDRGISTSVVELKDPTREEKAFNAITLADWTAVLHAKENDVEAEQVPMIEEFKKKLK